MHLVAAFAHQTRVVLTQVETVGKGHELAGVQAALAALPAHLLSGRVVTGDALLANRSLCQLIVQKGYYFIVLKANQPLTLEAVAFSFDDPLAPRTRVVVAGKRHGDREERRTLETATEVVAHLAQPEALDAEDGEAGTIGGWSALAQVCRIHREVEYVSGPQAGTARDEWAYALTSLPPAQADAARLEQLWRGHWQIENGLHYVRDVTLGEDACQVRSDRAPANLAACRNTALNLLRLAGAINVAAAVRRHAMYPREALALLGLH